MLQFLKLLKADLMLKSKILYLLLFFIIPVILFLFTGKFFLAGCYLGALSLLIFIEKNSKVRELIKRIF